jgi:hypothetical protein
VTTRTARRRGRWLPGTGKPVWPVSSACPSLGDESKEARLCGRASGSKIRRQRKGRPKPPRKSLFRGCQEEVSPVFVNIHPGMVKNPLTTPAARGPGAMTVRPRGGFLVVVLPLDLEGRERFKAEHAGCIAQEHVSPGAVLGAVVVAVWIEPNVDVEVGRLSSPVRTCMCQTCSGSSFVWTRCPPAPCAGVAEQGGPVFSIGACEPVLPSAIDDKKPQNRSYSRTR